jgi:hypothetical protein
LWHALRLIGGGYTGFYMRHAFVAITRD